MRLSQGVQGGRRDRRWCRHPWWLLGAGAFTARLGYLVEISREPVFGLLLGDARVYDQWARTIAGGDWLGTGVFYQAPLYPYLVGALYALFGPSVWVVALAQAMLSASGCVLLGLAGERFFGRRAGLAAGVVLALWPMAVFSDALLQKTSLELFLTSAVLFLLGRSARGGRRRNWLLLGLALGLLSLTRENAIALAAVLLAWLWWTNRRCSRREFAARGGLLAAGAFAALLPVGLRNLAVGGEFHVTTSQFGTNFFIGNNPEATGIYAPLRKGRGDAAVEASDARLLAENALGRRLTAGEISSYWAGNALRFIRAEPGKWLALTGRKLLLTWNRAEMTDTEDPWAYGEWSRLLGFLNPLLHFGVLAPVASAGVALTLRQRRRVWVLWAFLAVYTASVAVFYVFGRYRLPLVPVLALFGGAALARLPGLVRRGRWSRLGLAGLTALAAGVVAHLPLAAESRTLARALTFHNVGIALCLEGGRYAASLPYFRRAVELSPQTAYTYEGLAFALRKTGRHGEALSNLERALQLQPQSPGAWEARGNVHFDLGRWTEAARDYRAAIDLDPNRAAAHYGFGKALLRLGRPAEAFPHLATAGQLDPRYR